MNPHAGNGKGLKRWERIAKTMQFVEVQVSLSITEAKGDATRIAREAVSAGFTTLVAVGGDGTIHEVINGIAQDHEDIFRARLAVIPAGTGMDFVRNVGIRRDLRSAAERLAHPVERVIDVGVSSLPQRRVFMNFAETGIGAAVVEREAHMRNSLPGRTSYILSALDAIRFQRNMHARIEVDGQAVFDGAAVSIVVANGPYFGGGMKIAPGARMDDGSLQVVVLGDFSRGELLTHIWRIYPGAHMRLSKVASLQGRHVRIETDDSSRLDLDGELYGAGPYTFSILSQALRILV